MAPKLFYSNLIWQFGQVICLSILWWDVLTPKNLQTVWIRDDFITALSRVFFENGWWVSTLEHRDIGTCVNYGKKFCPDTPSKSISNSMLFFAEPANIPQSIIEIHWKFYLSMCGMVFLFIVPGEDLFLTCSLVEAFAAVHIFAIRNLYLRNIINPYQSISISIHINHEFDCHPSASFRAACFKDSA